MKLCPVCKKEAPDERKFCPFDGTPLPDLAPPASPGDAARAFPLLIIQSPGGQVQEEAITTTPINIGRAPDNDLSLSDPTISRHHATLIWEDGQYRVVDAGGRTGLFVNGRRVDEQGWALCQDDVITIGRTQITFQIPGIELGGHPSRTARTQGQPDSTPDSAYPEQAGHIEILTPSGERLYVNLAGDPVRIGAGADNDVVLDDPAISHNHAIIGLRDGGWYIQDAGSRNGVFVNRKRVGSDGQPIEPGDSIIIGRTRIALALGPETADVPVLDEKATKSGLTGLPPTRPFSPKSSPSEAEGAQGYKTPAAIPKTGPAGLPSIVLDNRYKLGARIAQTSTGTLYRARRIALGDEVLVRVLYPDLVRDPAAYARFRRGAQVAARIQHPNSVKIFDFGSTEDGVVYVVEELLSGRTLRNLIVEERGLTLQRVVGLFNQICGAVHAAHLNGIVLRDIKPESIFIEKGPDGKELIKVGGYGLAKLSPSESAGVTMASQAKVFGAPQYMSPEQWLERPLDSRSDVYSLGVILFELLTGAVPFDALMPGEIAQLHLTARVPDITELGRPDLNEDVAAVVNRALAKDPKDRQPTALNLASELQAVSGAPRGILSDFLSRTIGIKALPPVVVPTAPASVPAGEETLPSVVAAPEPKAGGSLNPVVLALMCEAFLSRISSGMIKTAVPLYALLVFGLDITSVMVLVLIQNIVPLLLRPFFGTLADRYGKKRVFLIALAIRTLVSILYALATLPLLFIISAIRGIADSAKGPSASAMIADNTDERHIAKAYSWYTTTKSTSGGIGEALAAFLLVTLIVFLSGSQNVTVNVAVLEENHLGKPVEEILKSPADVTADRMLPGTEANPKPRRVLMVEQRQMPLSQVPLEDLPKVIEDTFLRRALVVIFVGSTILSAISLILVAVFIREKDKSKKVKKSASNESALLDRSTSPATQPNIWAFALMGTALTAPAYMVTGEFFTVLAVKLEVTSNALGWIKILAETIVPLLFGPFFGWLADRVGTGKVIATRSIANLATSLLFWITPWFAGTFLLSTMMGLARGVDEIGKAAFKPTWGAIAAKVSSFNLSNRSRTMGILEGGVDASDLAFPVLAGLLLQYLSLGLLMAVRALFAIAAEVYTFILMRRYRI